MSHKKLGPIGSAILTFIGYKQKDTQTDRQEKYIYTRLLGRFAPILYLNCEHILFVYILKQRRKKFCGFSRI